MTVITLLLFGWFGPNTDAANRLITNILSVMLLLTAIVLIFRRQIIARYSEVFEVPREAMISTAADDERNAALRVI